MSSQTPPGSSRARPLTLRRGRAPRLLAAASLDAAEFPGRRDRARRLRGNASRSLAAGAVGGKLQGFLDDVPGKSFGVDKAGTLERAAGKWTGPIPSSPG